MDGILFKPDMHQAIRNETKTQTRRLHELKLINQEPDKWSPHTVVNPGYKPLRIGDYIFQHEDCHCVGIKPRYRVGEIVFIQEAWRVGQEYDALSPSGLFNHPVVAYKDSPLPFLHGAGRWRSPLFMPAWAARDFIKILAVRYERLQAITEEDAGKEGFNYWEYDNPNAYADFPCTNQFIEKWDSINPQYPWASNPWCVVYTFKKVSKP